MFYYIPRVQAAHYGNTCAQFPGLFGGSGVDKGNISYYWRHEYQLLERGKYHFSEIIDFFPYLLL